MRQDATVCVVGSINMDLIINTNKVPAQGETFLGNEFKTLPGGKGANQAIAAAKLGAEVNMIGAVGDDAFGKELLSNLSKEEINTDVITTVPKVSSGIANILLTNRDNRIIVVPGANYDMTPELVSQYKDRIISSDVVLLQLEVPIHTVLHTLNIAYEHHVPVILNPAPYQQLPDLLLEKVTYLTPNEIEADALMKESSSRLENKLITTLGEQGVKFSYQGQEQIIPGFKVDVTDTTGAGDTFNGAFAYEIAKGQTLEEAVFFANAAAALSVTKVGAQGGMTTYKEVKKFIEERG